MTSVAEYKKQLLLKRKLKENPLSLMEFQTNIDWNEYLLKAFNLAAKELLMNEDLISAIVSRALSYIPIPSNGKDGERGIDGETPVKGVDYFTAQDIKIISEKISAMIRQPEDGRTPIRGVDYFTDIDKQEFSNSILIDLNGGDLVKKINNLPLDKDKMIDASHIKNLPQSIGKETALFRGGLKMRYGTELEGTINGVNTIFTLPASAPKPKDGKFIVSARGVLKNSDSGDFTVSADNRTITFAVAPPTGSGRPRIELYEAH